MRKPAPRVYLGNGDAKDDRIKELEALLTDKDSELNEKSVQLAALRQEVERLKAELNHKQLDFDSILEESDERLRLLNKTRFQVERLKNCQYDKEEAIFRERIAEARIEKLRAALDNITITGIFPLVAIKEAKEALAEDDKNEKEI